jgi:hypothetical protein
MCKSSSDETVARETGIVKFSFEFSTGISQVEILMLPVQMSLC